jgi:hypothetical protein
MLKHSKTVLLILMVSVISSAYFFLHFWIDVLWIFLISTFFSFFYVWKVPGLKGKNLRDIPGAKIYIIAIIWVLVCGLMPALVANTLNSTVIWLCLSHFLFMIAITIPFDIRDITLDDQTKKTIPQIIGKQYSVYLSIILLIGSQAILIILHPNIGSIIFSVIGVVVLFKVRPNRPELYFSGLTDGLLILQPVLLWLFCQQIA